MLDGAGTGNRATATPGGPVRVGTVGGAGLRSASGSLGDSTMSGGAGGANPRAGSLGATIRGAWARYHDLLVAFGIVGVVAMMIVPLTPGWQDCLLALNLALTLVILLVAVYTTDPLQFSVLPSLLLLVTLFRLALNISGTRLILLQAHAGQVIDAFGNIVVGSSYIVGAVVFAILVVIQFVVITNGAQRVAEVAARFTLDGMPGKQMSIDADLNAGTITDEEARRRRQAVQQEADFYGSMDGASKFVRGDAIAAVIIIVVNVVGGLMVGVLQKGMEVLDALQTYTLLTVGEGLVTQIPALLVSTATGIVVTRAASNANLGEDLTAQLVARPRAMAVVAVLMLAMLAVPGLPRAPFLLIGAGLGIMAWLLSQAPEGEEDAAGTRGGESRGNELSEVLGMATLELSVGSHLVPLIDRARGGTLLDRLGEVRLDVAGATGVPVPALRVRPAAGVVGGTYVLRLFGSVIAQGEVHPDQVLAVVPRDAAPELAGPEGPVSGEATVDAASGLPALWIGPSDQERARAAGFMLVTPTDSLVAHLYQVLENHAAELLGRQEVRRLLDMQKAERPVLVDDLVPALLPLGDVQRVLRNLLEEHIPIRNLPGILEAMADAARVEKDPSAITELVRRSLARTIVQHFAAPDGDLYAICLAPELEQAMMAAMTPPGKDIHAIIGMAGMNAMFQSLTECMKSARAMGLRPIIMTNAGTRLYFRLLIQNCSPDHVVLSYSEIPRECVMRTVGQVRLGPGGARGVGLEAGGGTGSSPAPGSDSTDPAGGRPAPAVG